MVCEIMCFPYPLRIHNLCITVFLLGWMGPLLLVLHILQPPESQRDSLATRYFVVGLFFTMLIGGGVGMLIGLYRYLRYYRDWVPPDAPYLTQLDEQGRVIDHAHNSNELVFEL